MCMWGQPKYISNRHAMTGKTSKECLNDSGALMIGIARTPGPKSVVYVGELKYTHTPLVAIRHTGTWYRF